ncbi:MAG: hypothetical protein PHV57_00635 [Methanomicrobiaceae archaeon]|nr:hypothetical protein [Methanomicrobiaceae archaeon]
MITLVYLHRYTFFYVKSALRRKTCTLHHYPRLTYRGRVGEPVARTLPRKEHGAECIRVPFPPLLLDRSAEQSLQYLRVGGRIIRIRASIALFVSMWSGNLVVRAAVEV